MTKQIISAAFSILLSSALYADNINQNIQLKDQQQTLQISLPANSTTGYQWFVQSYDHELLDLQSYRYVDSNSKMLGHGGNAVFVFNIDPRFYDAPQSSNISFMYNRPWGASQNTSSAEVTVSSTASSNDDMNWQKYPDVDTNSASMTTPTPSNNSGSNNWISLPNTTANS